MKSIIKRNLPLNTQYQLIDKYYVPIIESFGTCCDNCGKLIANIAVVKSESGTFSIGFDCLETILINNHLLSDLDVAEYEKTKDVLLKIVRKSKEIKEFIENNAHIALAELKFKPQTYASDYYDFYYCGNFKSTNSYLKIKGINIEILVKTLSAIFPKIKIHVE